MLPWAGCVFRRQAFRLLAFIRAVSAAVFSQTATLFRGSRLPKHSQSGKTYSYEEIHRRSLDTDYGPAWSAQYRGCIYKFVVFFLALNFFGQSIRAQTWNGAGSLLNSKWSNGGALGNWSGAAAPANNGTANVAFGGSQGLTPDMDANWSINSLAFNSGAGVFVLGSTGGFTLTIQGGGITNNSTNTETINNAVTLGAAQTWSATAGNLAFGGSIANGGFLLTISGSSNTSATGVISGTGGLTKSGAGTLTLSGANTYTGTTSISAGTLTLNGSIASGSTVSVATAGTLNGTGTINGNATLTGNGIINFGSGATIAGTLGVTGGNWNGAGSVTGLATSSSGAFTIGSGANLTVNGNLNVTGGTIVAVDSTSTITGNVNYMSSSSSTYQGVIAGTSKTLTVNNSAGNLTLTGANTFTGSTTVSAGTLNAGATNALRSTSGITVNSGGTLLISGNGNLDRINNSAGITLAGGAFGRASNGTNTVSEGVGATNMGGTVSGTSSVGLGALTLTATSTLDFQSGTGFNANTGGVGTLVFSSFVPNGHVLDMINYSSTATPSNSGTDGINDRLIFNQDESANLADFVFVGGPAGGLAREIMLDSGFFEIVPIPEAGTWVAGDLALMSVLYTQQTLSVCARDKTRHLAAQCVR